MKSLHLHVTDQNLEIKAFLISIVYLYNLIVDIEGRYL